MHACHGLLCGEKVCVCICICMSADIIMNSYNNVYVYTIATGILLPLHSGIARREKVCVCGGGGGGGGGGVCVTKWLKLLTANRKAANSSPTSTTGEKNIFLLWHSTQAQVK